MSTTTPNMGLTKPDPDASIGTWDTELNASLDSVDAHDHTTGNGVPVPTAGIDIDEDLSFAGFGAVGLKVVDMAAVLASEVTGYPTALFVNDADNELYWRTSGGSNVKLTSGTSLNAALLGGFTGDYGSGGSEASFTSGTSIYNFLRAANHRAFIDCSDIRLFQGTSGITNAVKLRSPNALAASYEFIFPSALPAQADVLSISTSGQVTTGLKRGPKVRHISAMTGQPATGTGDFGTDGQWENLNLSDVFLIPILVDQGERITALALRVHPTAGGIGAQFNRLNADGTVTTIASFTASSGTTRQTMSLSGLTETVGSTEVSYHVLVAFGGAGTNCKVGPLTVTTDVP